MLAQQKEIGQIFSFLSRYSASILFAFRRFLVKVDRCDVGDAGGEVDDET
jgi:hypothetical protein